MNYGAARTLPSRIESVVRRLDEWSPRRGKAGARVPSVRSDPDYFVPLIRVLWNQNRLPTMPQNEFQSAGVDVTLVIFAPGGT